jgi:hypothetical protein
VKTQMQQIKFEKLKGDQFSPNIMGIGNIANLFKMFPTINN